MDMPLASDRGRSLSKFGRTAPPLVGRRLELDWLEQASQEVLAGHPRVGLIMGDAGIGKTRLLQEVRTHALQRRMQVCYGRCYEDLTLPYLPFVDALRAQLAPSSEDDERIPGADLEALRRLLFPNATTGPAGSPAVSAQSEQGKLWLFLSMSRAIVKLAQHCPTLLIVDDLHWADHPSLDLFSHLVFTVADTALRESVPLFIIGTYRPLEPEGRLARMITRLQREPICQTCTLAGFNESEIRDLVQDLGVVRPSHQLIATVSEVTQGNPLFIQEILHHLAQHDALQERGGYVVTTAAPADVPLPAQLTSALIARTQGLSEDCRRVLTLASCVGETFSVQVLSAVSDIGEEALLDLLEEGARQRLLVSDGQGYRFAHPLIQHVFNHQPNTARRQRFHRQIAESLQRLYVANPEAHVLEITHHLVRAGPAADAETVMDYARRAGDRAFKVYAWGEAARYYEAALAAGETSGRLSVQDRAELHYWAGRAYYWDQDVGPCLEHYDRAIAAYRLAGDMCGLAQALMGKVEPSYTFASVPFGTLQDLQPLEEMLAALGESEPGLRGRMAAVMAEAYRNARQTAKARAMAERALEIGQRLQDDALCAQALCALSLAYIQGLDVEQALESWQNALEYARRAGDLILQSWPLQRMPLALTIQGRLEEAASVAQAACTLTRQTQLWSGYSVALSHLASVAVARGDFQAMERYAYEAVLMVYRSGYPWGGARALPALACARALRGAWAEAEDVLDMLVEPGRIFQEAGRIIQTFAQAFRHLLRAYAGIREETIEPFAADLMRAVGVDTYSLAPLCALVELADLMDAPAIAEIPSQKLVDAVERGLLFSSGWMFCLPRVLGVAAVLQRQWDKAEAYFQTAIDITTRIGARPELGRTYLDYARLCSTRGGRSLRRQAIELVRQASSIFHELGMEPFVRHAAQLAETLQTRIPIAHRRRAVTVDNLSVQEVEILLQIARGRTDQEIADGLVLRPETIARHVHSIYDKIGVNGRTAAATYATATYVAEQILAARVQPDRGPETTTVTGSPGAASKGQSSLIILVTDLAGSAALIQRWGDVRSLELLNLHNAIIRDGLRVHHGTEVIHTGDGIEASFLSASSAVTCAVAIQYAFARHNQENREALMRVRIGINAGEPIPTEGRLFGTAIHMAFRICTRARPGQILVSDAVRQLVAGKSFIFVDRGRAALKGFPGRPRLYEVQWEGEELPSSGNNTTKKPF